MVQKARLAKQSIKARIAVKKISNLIGDIKACLSMLGVRLPKKGVLIKPNLVYGAPPGKGICTSVLFLDALIKLLRSKGIEPVLAEGSGSEPIEEQLKAAQWDMLDVKFIDLNDDRFVKVKIKDALEWDEICIAKSFMRARYVINVPIPKCHHIVGFSGAIKNLMGAIMPGPERKMHEALKRYMHREWSYGILPLRQAKELFERRLIDLLRVRPINLTLFDGLYANSIYESSSAVVKTNFVLASKDAIAADIACSRLLGFKQKELYYLELAQKRLGKRIIIKVGDRLKPWKFRRSKVFTEALRTS